MCKKIFQNKDKIISLLQHRVRVLQDIACWRLAQIMYIFLSRSRSETYSVRVNNGRGTKGENIPWNRSRTCIVLNKMIP